MEITVNKVPRVFDGVSKALPEVIAECGMPIKGIAVAINNKVVRKADWETTEVCEGDNVTIIQAVCGG